MDPQTSFVVICVILAVVGWKLFLIVCRPDVYKEQQRQKHEKDMENKKRNNAVLGIGGKVLDYWFKGK